MGHTKKLFYLALPAMGENLLQLFMGLVDSYLIARLGVDAISGVAMANQILSVYQALFIAVGVATASIISRSHRQPIQQDYYQAQAITLTVGLSVVLGLLSLFLAPYFLKGLGAGAAVVGFGAPYLTILGGGCFSLALLTTLGAVARAKGRGQLPFAVSLLTLVLNMIGSAVALIYLDLGLIGVGLATVLSRLVGVWLLGSSLKIRIWRKELFEPLDRSLIALVLPSVGERLMMRVGDVLVMTLLATLGTSVVAGNAIGETLTQVNYMPGIAFATATVVLMGQVSEKDRSCLIGISYFWMAGMMLVVSGIVWLLGPFLIGLFILDSSAVASSQIVLFYSFLGSGITAGALLYAAVWQGLGEAQLPFYATSIGMWGIRILFGYFLVEALGIGLSGIWLATIADNFWRFVFLAYRYHRHQGLESPL